MEQVLENKKDIKDIKDEMADQKLEYSVALATIITQNDMIIEKLDDTKIASGKNLILIGKLEKEKLSKSSIKKALQMVLLIGTIIVTWAAIGGLL